MTVEVSPITGNIKLLFGKYAQQSCESVKRLVYTTAFFLCLGCFTVESRGFTVPGNKIYGKEGGEGNGDVSESGSVFYVYAGSVRAEIFKSIAGER